MVILKKIPDANEQTSAIDKHLYEITKCAEDYEDKKLCIVSKASTYLHMAIYKAVFYIFN